MPKDSSRAAASQPAGETPPQDSTSSVARSRIDKQAITELGSQSARAEQPAKPSKATKRRQKESLRTLVENSSVSRARSAGRIVKYGAASFRRNIWLSIAATLVMTITLIILLVTVGASMVLSATADTMRQKIDITIFFRPGTSQELLNTMAAEMVEDQNVSTITLSDSQTEYQNFLAENQSNAELLAALADDDMRQLMLDSMQATMRIKVHNPEDLSGLRYIVENSPTFQANLDPTKEPTYDVNQAEIATISSWATVAKNGGLILSAIFLVISILVIFNTIRMAIFSRREEIYMMRLVGADTNFIRGPFLIEAQICGIISGILATSLAYAGYHVIQDNLAAYGVEITQVTELMTTNKLVLVYAAAILAGVLVGSLSARLAMQKYLK